MPPAEPDPEEMTRAEALKWVEAAHDTRSSVLTRLSAGTLSLSDLCETARQDPLIGMIRILVVLEALPAARKVQTRRSLDQLSISHFTPLSEVDTEVLIRGFVTT